MGVLEVRFYGFEGFDDNIGEHGVLGSCWVRGKGWIEILTVGICTLGIYSLSKSQLTQTELYKCGGGMHTCDYMTLKSCSCWFWLYANYCHFLVFFG